MTNPFQNHIEKNGRKIKRTYILYIETENKSICDSCDKEKYIAIIDDIHGNTNHICEQCLQSFVNAFNKE